MDLWSCILNKSYVIFGDKYGSLTKCNDERQYNLVKRIYKCREHNDLSKFTVAGYNQNKKAKQQVVILMFVVKQRTCCSCI